MSLDHYTWTRTLPPHADQSAEDAVRGNGKQASESKAAYPSAKAVVAAKILAAKESRSNDANNREKFNYVHR